MSRRRHVARRCGATVLLGAVCVAAWLPSGGCRSAKNASPGRGEGGRPRVFAANAALEYFARRIGGDAVDVWFPVPADVDPAFWRPNAKTLSQIQQCDLILLNHPGYSSWVATSSLPPRRVVDSSRSFAGRLIELTEAVTHRHGPGGEHSHRGTAVGCWLDPDLAQLQAQTVYEALVELLPDQRASFEQRWQKLVADLGVWRQQLAQVRSQTKGTPLLASHPVYDYLARWGEWPLSSVHWEPHEEPSAEEWAKLDALRERSGAQVMLWEDEPLASSIAQLEQRKIRWVVYHPLAQVPRGADWLEEMRANVDRLAAALNVER